MLTSLSIRDVVLIERLDLNFGSGLTTLTGETGAGKSILLDSLGLALGARADADLVRETCLQATVSAAFVPAVDHPALALLDELGLPREDTLVLRRLVQKDGRSRAWVNDQPVGVTALRRLGAALVEVQGQHEQMGLADAASHAGLLDAFGVDPACRAEVAARYRAWKAAAARLAEAREAIAAAAREEDYLRHAAAELDDVRPEPGEEDALAARRHALQQGERRAEAIAAAIGELSPRDRRHSGPAPALRAAARALQRLGTPAAGADDPVAPAMAAIERAEEALAEAEQALSRLAAEADADPRELERTEERLFALRAAGRKYSVPVSELAALRESFRERLAALDRGVADIAAMERTLAVAQAAYATAATALSAARDAAATRLAAAVMVELPPLRLDRAEFVASVTRLPAAQWGAAGADSVRFLISTNPGVAPGPLDRVASGGELSRLMLALKVVLSAGSAVATLVFDEVDSGVGGATAAAVGHRLARVAGSVQVLVVTHSPQVAARGDAHLVVRKTARRGQTRTDVAVLDAAERQEEIARMLAGESVTPAARAAAASLLVRVG